MGQMNRERSVKLYEITIETHAYHKISKFIPAEAAPQIGIPVPDNFKKLACPVYFVISFSPCL